MVHDTPEDIAARHAFHERMRKASAEVVARTLPRSVRALTVDSEQIDGRVLEAAPRRMIDASTGEPAATDLALRSERPADLEAVLLEAGVNDDEAAEAPVDELTAYNRYLAMLAVKGKPKTWRNPRGL